jgi:hypothetical protein
MPSYLLHFAEEVMMKKHKMPHPNHENHLCYLENIGYLHAFPEAYKDLVRNGKFMCRACGHVASKKDNLCAPEKL